MSGAGVTRPVTPARVAEILATRRYVTQIISGVVQGAWDGFEVRFRLQHASPPRVGGPDDGADDTRRPSLLVVEADWGIDVPDHLRPALLITLNDWNRGVLWPTGLVRRGAGEGWTVQARLVADVGEGLSDEQLAATLDLALRSSVALLRSLGTPGEQE